MEAGVHASAAFVVVLTDGYFTHNVRHEVACAVDDRNAPARNLYASLGFRESGHRVAMVKSL